MFFSIIRVAFQQGGTDMVKRLISASYSEVAKMTAEELKQSIKASEGRTILSENVVIASPQAGDISNAEVVMQIWSRFDFIKCF